MAWVRSLMRRFCSTTDRCQMEHEAEEWRVQSRLEMVKMIKIALEHVLQEIGRVCRHFEECICVGEGRIQQLAM